MEITILESHEDLSRQAAAIILRQLEAKKDMLLCAATGDTPARTYELMSQEYRHRPDRFSDLTGDVERGRGDVEAEKDRVELLSAWPANAIGSEVVLNGGFHVRLLLILRGLAVAFFDFVLVSLSTNYSVFHMSSAIWIVFYLKLYLLAR